MLERLRERWANKDYRRVFWLMLCGKLVGAATILAIIQIANGYFFQSAHAEVATVGRTGFVGRLLCSFGVSGFIYPILGHCAWSPDGWLNTTHPVPFDDFAGSTVVHTIGGFVAVTGAFALGPRLGRKFKPDGG